MATYESEHTKFMREWMQKHPQERVEQQTGRGMWWDKPQDADACKGFEDARVEQKPYVYQTEV